MVAKSLRNRVRGWFPQEPYIISRQIRQVKVDHETKQPPLMIPPQYKVSATKTAGIMLIYWIILYGFISYININLERYPVSAFQIVAWIVFGVTAGAILGMYVTKNQLRRLSKEYKFVPNGKDLIIISVPIILYFIVGGFVIYSFQGPSGGLSTLGGLMISSFSWIISLQVTRYLLFAAFEKKERMRLMQSWWDMGIYLVPEAPESQLNKRGELLTFFLAAGIVGSVLAAASYATMDLMLLTNSTGLGDVLSGLSVPLWTLTVYPILAIMNVCALVALYRWRKWGFYVLLTSALALFTMNIVIVGFRPESIVGLIGIAVSYVLLRTKWSLLKSGWPNVHKHLSLLLAIAGIILVISSLALTSHVEDRLISVPKTETIAHNGFYTNQSIPDTEIQANLTTQERLHFGIIVARVYSHMSNGSSVTFTISNQSLTSGKPTNVYFTNDQIGLPNDYYMYWSAPENGTYYFTLNYNLTAGNYISYGISKATHVEESVQVAVFTPYFTQYLAPTMILASALLATSIAIQTRDVLHRNPRQFDNA